MAKGIFSFLFSDGGAETGVKKDGKGTAELVSMGNEEAAKQVQLSKDKGTVKGKENSLPEQQITNQQKSKNKNVAMPKNASKKHSRVRKNLKKYARTRELEINDELKMIKQDVKELKKSTLNKDVKLKAVKEFINQLPPETKELITSAMKENVKQTQKDVKTVTVKKKTSEERLSKREILERKRGIYREQSTLRLAKLAAEKARAMVKSFKDRILGKKTVAPSVERVQKSKEQNENKNISKMKKRQNERR